MMKKTLSLLLAAAMLLAALSACGAGGEDVELIESPEPSAEAEATPPAEPEASPEASAEPAHDWQALLASRDADEVMMTVDGSDVTWDEFFYWLYVNVDSFEASYGQMDYSTELTEGMTYADYMKMLSEQYAVAYHSLNVQAAAEGYALTDEDRESLDEAVRQTIVNNCGEDGTEEDFEEFLAGQMLTRRVFDFVNETTLLNQRVWIDRYGAAGELYPEADAISWGEGQGYVTVKHILVLTQDEEGNALDDAAKEEKLAQAEGLLEQLRPLSGSEEVVELFDELMQENSEDPGLASYPNGYCYMPGTMYAEFEDAATALGEYEVSDIVESTSGYHIILRLPLSKDDILFNYGYNLQYVAAQMDFGELVNGWAADAEVVYEPAYEELDIAGMLQ